MSETEPVPEYCLTIPIPMQKRNIKGILWSAAQLFPFKKYLGDFVLQFCLCYFSLSLANLLTLHAMIG